MPTPENGYGGSHERSAGREHEPVTYHRAARFREEWRAARTYRVLQETIRGAACDLSAYRLLIDQVSHVIAIGEPPEEALDQQIAEILADGQPAELPPEVVTLLRERREQAGRLGPWVEGHVRPVPPNEP